MPCQAAIKEVRKRAANVRLDIMDEDGLRVTARRIFKAINWWHPDTIYEALVEVKREKHDARCG